MGKKRRKNRAKGAPGSVMTAAPPRARKKPPAMQMAQTASHQKSAIPLTNTADPLVMPEKADHTQQDDLQPLPRNYSLAVQNYGVFAKLSFWLRRKFYKPPSARNRKEAALTRKQLKDLRRQITVMERTLGRMT